MPDAPAVLLDRAMPPAVVVPGDATPVTRLDGNAVRLLGQRLSSQFDDYRRDRRMQEQRWLRNLRQILGFYDPEVEKSMPLDKSRAYPKITRVKCVSMLSRIVDLMFPSDDRNWTLEARPSVEMDIADVKQAISEAMQRDGAQGGNGPQVDDAYVEEAVQALAAKRAAVLMKEIDDQLQELGGDQSYDYVALVRQVVASGIFYGIGVLTGPFAREVTSSTWKWNPQTQQPEADTSKRYMPQFEFTRCWDYYPDMSAKRVEDGDGYYIRHVMSKRQLRELANRPDFFGDVIKRYLRTYGDGNYKPQEFETELRGMGVRVYVNDQKPTANKFEVISWHGPISGTDLAAAGVQVADDKLSEQIDAEVWTLGNYVIKCVMNPWKSLGVDVRTDHVFIFDHDDTSPIGYGLPNIMRDTQMSISNATRMMLDNASIVCGPIVEVNTAVMRGDTDFTSIYPGKFFYRDDDGPSMQYPAVREIKFDNNIDELKTIVDLFMQMADIETFVGPTTGGDMSKMPSEPMRNAAGASMLMGNAALPFKDVIRNFDRLTMSVIQSLVSFNRLLNPSRTPVAAYDVIARGATSLIAKEVRGAQLDQLAASLKPEDMVNVNRRKLLEARFAVRDMPDMLVPAAEAKRLQAQQDAMMQAQQDIQQRTAEAVIRKTLGDAFKALTQGQKNQATASVEQVDAALDIMARDAAGALTHAKIMGEHARTAATLHGMLPEPAAGGQGDAGQDGGGSAEAGGGAAQPAPGGQGAPPDPNLPPAPGDAGVAGGAGLGLVPPGGGLLPSGAGQGFPGFAA